MTANIAVIIAAYAAEATIASAILSALAEPEVAEVVVVDDASPDKTAAVAQATDDGTGRLAVHRLPRNVGPSAARNRAIRESSAPFISILDADDRVIPGRYAHLNALAPWDLAADNIVFFHESSDLEGVSRKVSDAAEETLDAAAYIQGNIVTPDGKRGELGFLKPVFSRAFLDREGFAYNETMRLGEDYELVVRMLLKGATFKITNRVGYAAMVRQGSLSARHGTDALEAQAAAERAMIARYSPPKEIADAMDARARQIDGKIALRKFLDAKSSSGYGGALAYLARHPGRIPPVVAGVARDKLRAARGGVGKDDRFPRYLLPLT